MAIAAKTTAPATKVAEKKTKAVKTFSYYPADDVKSRLPSSKGNRKVSKLRSSITPGTVLILLAGRFRGKRVVFLKQLTSGLLLVTGPFKLNGVPMRRVNQAYVIATSTKVDVSKVNVSNIDDKFFAKEASKTEKSAEGFAKQDAKVQNTLPAAKVSAQKDVDTAVNAAINAVPQLAAYLKTRFSLSKGDAPHLFKF
ncbi:60S large subunit ribosomal protein eL6 (rpL6) [Andalucia godoyi]|uniref:60S large subunit ribosomal protein eL6 (RpL6) n=1 Tax=Andalucia godoyi TaxID=505711 RepID=A0A8K0AIV4_ANDGO|nr:60S large subunit ribosomal protein eL6 (rpL6) [Andalucia godoyi]|eukprot:ANDGO_06341.mRNA.1 60S large subunit ribosomal protein eL6 (rpL6)